MSITGCDKSATITPAKAVTLNLSAAASLTDALKEVNALYTQSNTTVTIVANFAGSGTLQTQIENGAPVDVFISAAASQMNILEQKGLLLEGSRLNLLNNKIVLIVPQNNPAGINSFTDLSMDSCKRIAIGDPKSVPAGTYAQQAFDLLGISASIASKLVLGADARQVLTYVESGNVEAGVVYSTDALTSNRVKIVANAPDEINAKVVYPAAIIKASQKSRAASDYLKFLTGDKAKTVFEKYGFSMVKQ
jgi:molybdate transport system substrate-binding protein